MAPEQAISRPEDPAPPRQATPPRPAARRQPPAREPGSAGEAAMSKRMVVLAIAAASFAVRASAEDAALPSTRILDPAQPRRQGPPNDPFRAEPHLGFVLRQLDLPDRSADPLESAEAAGWVLIRHALLTGTNHDLALFAPKDLFDEDTPPPPRKEPVREKSPSPPSQSQ